MATIGELSDIGVADLIDVFTRRARSGRLAIKAGGQEVLLYFQAGRLALVTSTDITIRLGRMLVRQGLLDTPRLLEALHAQVEAGNKKPLGLILLERGWVTEADLTRCIEEQSIEALARAITDPPGLFVFEPDMAPPTLVESAPLDPGFLLRAAKERTEALCMLREQLPPPSAPLFLTAEAAEDPGLGDELAPPESMVVGVLRTGGQSLTELSFHVALDELSLGVAVLTLLERGIVVSGTVHIQEMSGNGRARVRSGRG